jgi:hypothetical protein
VGGDESITFLIYGWISRWGRVYLLNVEAAMNMSMTNHLTIVKATIEECQLASQILCDHVITIFHWMYVDIFALWLVKLCAPFIQQLCLRRLMMAFLTLKNTWKIGVKVYTQKLLELQIQVWTCVVSMGNYVCKVVVIYCFKKFQFKLHNLDVITLEESYDF